MDSEREKILEKRSSLRSWRERGGKIPHQNELAGAVLIAVVFLALVFYPYLSGSGGNSSSSEDQKNETSTQAPTPGKTSTQKTSLAVSQSSLPAPSIKIDAPMNTTYNTSTPPLSFIVAGSNLDTVLLSVDGGEKISVPHDGTIAKIDFAKLNPIFIEDFSGSTERQWTKVGSLSLESGKYVITKSGYFSIGSIDWDDYIVEAKKRIVSGDATAISVRSDGKNEYKVQPSGGNINLLKIDDKGYQTLTSTKLSNIDLKEWHIWKVKANGSKIQVIFDDVPPLIDYIDGDKPYLKGYVRLSAWSDTSVEYDNVQIYRPLADGMHNLTIFANNTASNASSQTIYFTVNTSTIISTNGTIGEIGTPVIKGGFEITVKSVTSGPSFISIWILVKNIEDSEKPFKLSPSPAIIDDKGNQYENIKISRSAEITQTNLYPQAIREGAVFFEKLKEGTKQKKLVLYINNEKVEFIIDTSK